jgi:hypothetical protein
MAQQQQQASSPAQAPAPQPDAAATTDGGNALATTMASLGGGGAAGGGGGGGSPADAAFDAAAGGAGGTPLPYKAEMENYFGRSFDDVQVRTGSPGGMAALNATAATRGNVIVFEDTSPAKELVVHELTHWVQMQGGTVPQQASPDAGGASPDAAGAVARAGTDAGPAGTTAVGGKAETEARGVASAFSSGAAAPAIGGGDSGVARDSKSGPTIDRLRSAAEGNWIGNVDEDQCLSLINQLTPAEKATAILDGALMRNLCGAFDANEMVRAVTALSPPLQLKWKAYWIDYAGETENVPPSTWQTFFVLAPQQEVLEFVSWNSLFVRIKPSIGTSPIVLFNNIRPTAAWGGLLGSSAALMTWLSETSPATFVLDEITGSGIADGAIPAIVANMKATSVWPTVTQGVGRGSAITPSNRTALRRLAGLLPQPDCGDLFNIRFNKQLTAASGVSWVAGDIRAVWDQLAVLPEEDVSENTALTVFRAIGGDQAFANGDGSIELGTGLSSSTFWGNGPTQGANNGTPNPGRLGHTVRHEIGHRVHAELQSTVDSWLQNGIKFWYFSGGAAGAASLIGDLGGFPGTFNDKRNDPVPFTGADQARINTLIANHSGGASWFPKASMLPATGTVVPDPTLPVGTTMTQAERDVLLWDALDPRVRNVFVQSDSGPWYVNYTSHSLGPKGSYFWNHWYGKPYYFSSTALATINATGDNYSSMSEAELFANCYATFFANPAGYNDHSLWGGISADVDSFMRTHILERQPYTPPAPGVGSGAQANVPAPGAPGG